MRGRPRLAQLVKVVEVGQIFSGQQCSERVINIYRDLKKQAAFFPIVFRREIFHVEPSFVKTVADEEFDVVDPAHKPAALTRASARQVLDSVMKDVRKSFKSAYAAAGQRPRLIELVRTVAVGPYDCPGEAPWYFTVKIYKDLDKKKTFFPIVFRRDVYRMKPGSGRKPIDAQLDIVEHAYETERFTRVSERAAFASILRHIRHSFERGPRARKVRA